MIQPDQAACGDSARGLTGAQARARLARGEGNRLPRGREGGVWSILRRNLFTFFHLLNLILAALLIAVGSYRNLLFLGVVFSNLFIGLVQELRAKAAHDRLELLAEGSVRALRDGRETRVPFGELVRGDVVRLFRGDQVPGDGAVLAGRCQADFALLTGESEPVPRNPGDELLSGSFLTEGAVTLRLDAVGAASYAGRLQIAARRVKRPRSQLMTDMRGLIRRVSVAIVPLGLLVFWRQTAAHGLSLEAAVTKAVAATLGMIPEGLVLLTSLALTVGVLRLARRRTLVNELHGIETLARTDVVCMDKTGTLTDGTLVLAETLPLGDITGAELACRVRELVMAQEEESPTLRALREGLGDGPEPRPQTRRVPFSSHRKWMAAGFAGGGPATLALGAPERLLADNPRALALAGERAAKGLRVLALAGSPEPLEGDSLPRGLTPLALLCLRDRLRPQVRDTVDYFDRQGVTLKILTGDSPLTAAAVARAAGLPGADAAMDLSACEGPPDYDALCQAYTVFGRVSPEDKRALVAALKRRGHGVAMVGDGVNDIPALKAADCSIAMGCGHSAACRVAQITLLDGDFSVLPDIVWEGRRVVNNITRAASLFLVKNLFSFLLAASLLALPYVYPFAPIQLTLISSLTVGIPSFVLAFQPSRERIRGDFLKNVFRGALPGGCCVWLLTLALSALGRPLGLSHGTVSSLCTLAAGISGLWVLLLTCRPLNALRAALTLSMAGLMAGAALWLSPVFGLLPLDAAQGLCLGGAALASPLLLLGMGALLGGKKRTGRMPPPVAAAPGAAPP